MPEFQCLMKCKYSMLATSGLHYHYLSLNLAVTVKWVLLDYQCQYCC